MTIYRVMGVGIFLLSLFSIPWGNVQAERSTHRQTFAPDNVQASRLLSFPQFNPEQGALQAVEIVMTSQLAGDVMAQSYEADNAEVRFAMMGNILLTNMDNKPLLEAYPQTSSIEPLPGLSFEQDGEMVHLSAAPMLERTLIATETNIIKIDDANILIDFVGQGMAELLIQSTATGQFNGPGNAIGSISTAISAEVEVVYLYTESDETNHDDHPESNEPDAEPEAGTDVEPDAEIGQDDSDGSAGDRDDNLGGNNPEDENIGNGNLDEGDSTIPNVTDDNTAPDVGEDSGNPAHVLERRIFIPVMGN